MAKQSFRHFLTNLDQPMPWPEKLHKLARNLSKPPPPPKRAISWHADCILE